jgi:hypothetical protein
MLSMNTDNTNIQLLSLELNSSNMNRTRELHVPPPIISPELCDFIAFLNSFNISHHIIPSKDTSCSTANPLYSTVSSFHLSSTQNAIEQSVGKDNDDFFHILNESEVQDEANVMPTLKDYLLNTLLEKLFRTELGSRFYILCQLYKCFETKLQKRSELAQCILERLGMVWDIMRCERNRIADSRSAYFNIPENTRFCNKFNCCQPVERSSRQLCFCEAHKSLSVFNDRHNTHGEELALLRLMQLLLTDYNSNLLTKRHFKNFVRVCLQGNIIWLRSVEESPRGYHPVVYLWEHCYQRHDPLFFKQHKQEFQNYYKEYIDPVFVKSKDYYKPYVKPQWKVKSKSQINSPQE